MTPSQPLLESERYFYSTHPDPRPVRARIMTLRGGAEAVAGSPPDGAGSPPDGAGSSPDGAERPQTAASPAPVQVVTVRLGPPPVHLARRHYQVLASLAEGRTSQQIASRLGISQRTALRYITDLKERFQTPTREELLVKAVRLGWL